MTMVPASTPDYSTVTASSQLFTNTVSGVCQFVANTNCWIKQGDASVTATAAAGSIFVPSGTIYHVHGDRGARLAVLRDTADGKASLTPVRRTL